MPYPQFDDLPFSTRPDLSPYVIHLTKNTKASDGYSAYDNLVSILENGSVWASAPSKGFIKGPNGASCFMDVPFAALKYVLTPENRDPTKPRYEPFGIFITKKLAYEKGCRPVLYLSNEELEALDVPTEERWRVVRFDVTESGWISWLHEREWRCKGDLRLPSSVQGVLVRTTTDAQRLQRAIFRRPDDFKCKPRSIIPLTVLTQGLLPK
jgi:hypothetical protein